MTTEGRDKCDSPDKERENQTTLRAYGSMAWLVTLPAVYVLPISRRDGNACIRGFDLVKHLFRVQPFFILTIAVEVVVIMLQCNGGPAATGYMKWRAILTSNSGSGKLE